MMRIVVDFNGITKQTITVANITEGGLSNKKINTYNIWKDGRDTGFVVEHWREDGSDELCRKVFEKLFLAKIGIALSPLTKKQTTTQGKCLS